MTMNRGVTPQMRQRANSLRAGQEYRARDLASMWGVTEVQARNFASAMRSAGLIASERRIRTDGTQESVYMLPGQEAA